MHQKCLAGGNLGVRAGLAERQWTDGAIILLGSAQAWFEGNAEDARAWLLRAGLINAQDELSLRLS